ncbi:ABC transporter ATP-binding protein [Marinicella sediminis]|uniref:ABC transporter ATP-binding protein n=1 Tax=Marinicella sediminis TaxID=1792834 RepID=A0ABV7JHB1_9GAMM|nr:ABC transporter ATP-binding protein [Marinicella sediminis]
MKTLLDIKQLTFAYAQQPLLQNINLTIDAGQVGCLLGPSGCGKSTLLRLIAGFEQPQSGTVMIDHLQVTGDHHMLPPQQRQVGMLFQDLALFPHLTVQQNIAFGLQHLPQEQRRQRTAELIQLCRLQKLNTRHPHHLSGGQCQRVALARAMAPKPKLILLDEPFSSVDRGLQSEMAQEVKSMLQADGSTALWVTHSLEEAFAVADQMGVMLNGQLLQWGTPVELHDQPASPDVIRFLNQANLINGQLNPESRLDTVLGTFDLCNADQFMPGDILQIGLSKHLLQVSTPTEGSKAIINKCIYQGGHHVLTATLTNGDQVQLFHHQSIPVGQSIQLKVSNPQPVLGFAIS